MNGLIDQPEEAIGAFVSDRMGRPHEMWGEKRAIGWVRDRLLVAGVIYNHFSTVSCCMHVAANPGRNWLSPEFLFAAFDLPFRQWNLRRVTGLVPKDNMDARRFDEHLGFQYEGEMRGALPDGGSLLVYGLLRDDCRWIREDFARKIWMRVCMRQNASTPSIH